MNLRAGKMMRILSSVWLPKLILLAGDFSRWFRKNSSLFGRLINPLLTKLVWSRWLGIGLVLFCGFIDLDSLHKNSKDNLANIQLS